ncbi:hypothetical protein MYMA111404_02930 [Mycoplasma marinum]|uniref:SHOCT domain-containing protein n=1 Tax=Mycoplasma marinum TaxID=1937190 RepID=A0A4R0XU18_9MOLU|nr:hypothetical protein [Mycoplasma marinum]TCG11287.1 hypothetical protein C4B24_02470 [Mycoplasma marinum]
MIVVIIIIALLGLGIGIWGIVAAATTKDQEMNVGKLLLHLFLWGGLIAAIIYAIKTSNSNQTISIQNQDFSNKELKKEDIVEILEKIDTLLNEGKITKEEHAELRKEALKKSV